MIKEAIFRLTQKKNLPIRIAKKVFEEIFDSETTPSQIASFLTALKMKGETEDEIFAAACVIREKATKLRLKRSISGVKNNFYPIMDTCGTGGSGVNKFNISTVTAFVVCSAGVRIAKHGNRAMSSNCGSADVLETLGINIGTNPSVMEKAIERIGIGFLYAPLYHPALGKVAQLRSEMGIRTIFNILGPLCNPALADYQLLGVFSQDLTAILARVLKKLGSKKAFVVYGKDLADEVSLTGPTKVCFLNNKRIRNFSLNPSSFGLKKVNLKNLIVTSIKESAQVIEDILKAKKGPPRDVVLANASVCFYISGKVGNFRQGAKLAAKLIDEGSAKNKFLEFKEFIAKNA